MRFFPSLTENFTSPLPPAELLGHVQDCVQQARDFSGHVTGNQFTISRVIEYRNSMLPRISGAVMAGPGGGSRLHLQHRLHPFVLAFAALWLGGLGCLVAELGLGLLVGLFGANVGHLGWPDLIPVGMFGVGLLLFTVPFWAEVRQSRPRLIALLRLVPVEAALAPPPGPSRRSAMSQGPS